MPPLILFFAFLSFNHRLCPSLHEARAGLNRGLGGQRDIHAIWPFDHYLAAIFFHLGRLRIYLGHADYL